MRARGVPARKHSVCVLLQGTTLSTLVAHDPTSNFNPPAQEPHAMHRTPPPHSMSSRRGQPLHELLAVLVEPRRRIRGVAKKVQKAVHHGEQVVNTCMHRQKTCEFLQKILVRLGNGSNPLSIPSWPQFLWKAVRASASEPGT